MLQARNQIRKIHWDLSQMGCARETAARGFETNRKEEERKADTLREGMTDWIDYSERL
jgi:hypothetical protein